MKDDQVEDYPFSFYTEKDVRICFYFKFLKVINIIHIYRLPLPKHKPCYTVTRF